MAFSKSSLECVLIDLSSTKIVFPTSGVLLERVFAHKAPSRLAHTIDNGHPWATLFVLNHWAPKWPLTLKREVRFV